MMAHEKTELQHPAKRDWSIFICAVFFVLGFSIIFSLAGVLLQTTLSEISFEVQVWLARIGGVFIIGFGLLLLGLINFSFLEREYKFKVRGIGSKYLTSFAFGAAFAVGWTPCVGPVLGAVLALAVSNPGSAFALLLAYSIGLGLPFLLVGLFTNQARSLILRYGKVVRYLNIAFGVIVIALGVLVFTRQLERLAAVPFLVNFLFSINAAGPSAQSLSIGVSFLAGLISFLSPCVLPLIPGFLAYLASVAVRK